MNILRSSAAKEYNFLMTLLPGLALPSSSKTRSFLSKHGKEEISLCIMSLFLFLCTIAVAASRFKETRAGIFPSSDASAGESGPANLRRHLVNGERVPLRVPRATRHDSASAVVPEPFIAVLVMLVDPKIFQTKHEKFLKEIEDNLQSKNVTCDDSGLRKVSVKEYSIQVFCQLKVSLNKTKEVTSPSYASARSLLRLFSSASMRGFLQEYNVTRFFRKESGKKMATSFAIVQEVWFPVAAVAASSFLLAFVLVLIVCCCRKSCCRSESDKVNQLESVKHGAYVCHNIKPIETMSPTMVQPQMKELYTISGSPRKAQRWTGDKKTGLLQSRRGSQASLVLDLSPMVREPVIDFSHESPTEESLSKKTKTLTFKELEELKENEKYLYKEFWDIPSNAIHRKDKQSMSNASLKNRYPDFIPNSKTAVKLKEIDNDPQSSYINANYIRGYSNSQDIYIATEGPLQSTVADFWRMIWECRCPIIIMVTKLKEKNEEKCAEYWPHHKSKSQQKFGDITVTFDSEVQKNGYKVTKLYISHGKFLEESRWVTHYWLSSWPDHKSPKTSSDILSLAKEMRENRNLSTSPLSTPNGPVVVHCSAGRGRTGCFIAICQGIDQLERENSVDILKIVSSMRIDRGGMVQKDEQYIFLYRTLFEYWKELRSRSPARNTSDIEAAGEAKEQEVFEQGHFVW